MNTPPFTRATMVDVARQAKVSKKTVSRVINDEPNVRQSVRTHVRKIIEKLNYTPSLAARSLAKKRSFLVGLLYDNGSSDFVSLVQGSVLEKCRAEGLHLLVDNFDSQTPHVEAAIMTMIAHTRVDGLILLPPLSDNPKIVDGLHRRGIAYALISTIAPDHPCANIDEVMSAYDLTNYLLSLGHTRIAFVKGDPAFSVSHQRYLGFCKALAARNLKIDPANICQGSFTFESGWSCGKKLLQKKDRPTAIFAANDFIASGVIAAANSLGISVPADVSVAGFDDTQTATSTWPKLTTVRYPMAKMAAAAVELLLAQRGKKEDGAAAKSRIFPHEIVKRDSTAPRAPGK